MYRLGATGGVVAFIFLLLIVSLVKRVGDLQGIWLPANVLAILYGIIIALIPVAHWQLCYIVFPLLGGSSAALGGFCPELLAKLVPPDVQGTFQTAKAFLFDFQRAILVWPWLGLLICSEDFAYPFDALPIWIGLILGVVALWLTLKQLKTDPQIAILEGQALDAFYDTPYAKGTWYLQHGGRPLMAPSTSPCHSAAVTLSAQTNESGDQFPVIMGCTDSSVPTKTCDQWAVPRADSQGDTPTHSAMEQGLFEVDCDAPVERGQLGDAGSLLHPNAADAQDVPSISVS